MLYDYNNLSVSFQYVPARRLDIGSTIYVHPESINDSRFSYCHQSDYNKPRGRKRAKFASTCKRCVTGIAVGDEIEPWGEIWVHYGCEKAQVLSEEALKEMAKKALVTVSENPSCHSPLSFLQVITRYAV